MGHLLDENGVIRMRYQLPNVKCYKDGSNDYATHVEGQEKAALFKKHAATEICDFFLHEFRPKQQNARNSWS